MDRAEVGIGHKAFRKGIANAVAERVDQVFLGMAIGREVDPLAAAPLPAVRLESGFQPHASGVDQEVAGLKEEVEGLQAVQNHVVRPAGEDPRAEHLLVLGVDLLPAQPGILI
jgi:hypothetical protein